MTERVTFPDVVAALRSWMPSRVLAPVVVRIPNPRPTKLVRLGIAGGSRLDVSRQQVRLLVEAWEKDEYSAWSLADLCASWIEMACRDQAPVGTVWVEGVPEDFSVPVLNPDPLTDLPRYQFYCNLTLRGSST